MSPSEMNRRTMIGGFMLGGTAALLAACSGTSPSPGAVGTRVATGDPASPAATAAGPIVLTDQLGNKITLAQAVTRVVTIPMPAASLLVAVDQSADHLTAMHNASWIAMRDGIMGEMFPKALDIPHNIAQNDFTPNVESIRALNPDIVVQWSDSALTEPLQNVGLTVLGLQNSGTQEDVNAWVVLFATMLGKPERATQMKTKSDAEQKEIETLAAGRTGTPPSILYFNRVTGGLKVAGTKSYNDFYIKLVGGTNPATGDQAAPGTGMVGVDVEQVLAWDPEVILLGNFDDAMPKDIYSNPVWKNISAVKNKRVYKVPLGGYRWDPPGQESPLMWRWLTDIAFPEKTSTLRSKVADYYQFLYAQQPTSAQMNKILWTAANGASANYQQFDAS